MNKINLFLTLFVFTIFIKNSLSACTTSSIRINNLYLNAENVGNVFGSGDESICESGCLSRKSIGAIGWSRHKSTQYCYCKKQPFGNGGVVSAYNDTNFASGFFPNRTPFSPACASFILQGQVLHSNVPPLLTFNAFNFLNCGETCATKPDSSWSYSQNHNPNCICTKNTFDQDALTYAFDWWFGFNDS